MVESGVCEPQFGFGKRWHLILGDNFCQSPSPKGNFRRFSKYSKVLLSFLGYKNPNVFEKDFSLAKIA